MATDAGLMRLLSALPETASAKNLRALAVECFGAPGGESNSIANQPTAAATATAASSAAPAATAEGMDDAVCGADCVTDAALRHVTDENDKKHREMANI